MFAQHRLLALAFATLALAVSVAFGLAGNSTASCDPSDCPQVCDPSDCPPECLAICEESCPLPCASACDVACKPAASGASLSMGVLDPLGTSALRLFAGQSVAVQE